MTLQGNDSNGLGIMIIGMMDVIFTEDEYREALKRFLEICDAEDNTPEAEELEQLMTIMEIYEQENCH